MRLKAILLLLIAAAAFAAPASATTNYNLLFAFTGFDYENPNPSTGVYLDLGEGYNEVGFVTQFGGYLTPYINTSTTEYTNSITGLTVIARFFSGGFLECDFANGGRARYYEDSKSTGTPAVYGINPPNATSPSTFVDGTVGLGGSVDNFILDINYNTSPVSGTFQGTMTLDEGSELIYIPAGSRSGWTLGGTAGEPNPTVPAGYVNQVTGQCQVQVTPTEHKTWGAIKALYR